MSNFDFSNRVYKVLSGFLIVLAVYFVFQLYIDYKTLPQNNIYPEMISISGEGKASIVPDIAGVDLGIITEGTKVEDIVQINTDKMNSVISEIKNLGIEEKDIKTTNYSLQPRYEWTDTGSRVSKGYTLTQSISVKIRDFSKIGKILETASAEGVNNIGALRFTIDDMEKARATARGKAIEQAKEKAKMISKETGLKLKKIISIYEDNNGVYPSYDYAGAGVGSSSVYKESLSSVAPSIQTGEQEITVRITLNYRTK